MELPERDQAANDCRSETVVAKLRDDLRRWGGADDVSDADVVSTGWEGLDAILPSRGVRRGSLVEWIGEPGGGAQTIAFAVARRVAEDRGALVVVDRDRTFFPVAAAALGVDLSALVVVRPRTDQDALWAYREALASSAVPAVWGRLDRLPGRSYRQLQLAAEEAGTVGLLLRSPNALSEPTWSDATIRVQPVPGRQTPTCRAAIARSRDGQAGIAVELALRDEIEA